MQINTKFTISNFFIILSTIFLVIKWYYPNIIYYLWMHSGYYETWKYIMLPFQFIFSNFLHWNIMHLLFNSIFIFIFWNQVEEYIWKTKYILFFLFSSFFIWILFLIFSNPVTFLWYTFDKISWITIWISGFAMGLLSFYTLVLYFKWIDEYKWWIMAIFLNIIIGLNSNISFSGHLFWAISGIIFYFIIKNTIKRENLLKL